MNDPSGLILGLDQGTTGTTVLLFDRDLKLRGRDAREVPQHLPHPGWVEHDPEEIWNTCTAAIAGALETGALRPDRVAAIGIAVQRETIVLWNRTTGVPVHRAIVWQDRRTSADCEQLRAQGLAGWIHDRTGLVADPYFSATKLKWILDRDSDLRRSAGRGELAAGTIDTWLLWKLTGGAVHATDETNASRTLLYNLEAGAWDPELLALFDIPIEVLPEIRPSAGVFGETSAASGLPAGITIGGMAGDQQSAMVGQRCFSPGDAKCTYGTGAFLLAHTGDRPVLDNPALLATRACSLSADQSAYALEGSVFICGAALQWLRDGIGILATASESEFMASRVEDNGGVYFVPAFVGLGAPYWDPDARGVITGLTRGTRREHFARAALEAIAHQVTDLVEEMERTAGIQLPRLRADGGASSNDWLMTFQAGLLDRPVERPWMVETTATGAAILGGLGAGVWSSVAALPREARSVSTFEPAIDPENRAAFRAGWRAAIRRALTER